MDNLAISVDDFDKLERIGALHAKWMHEDAEDAEDIFDGQELRAFQQSRYKDVGLTVFGFT